MDISRLKPKRLAELVSKRWDSASEVWGEISRTYERNTMYYDCDSDAARMPDHVSKLRRGSSRARSNRIFRDTESGVNSLIANPSKPNAMPGRDTDESRLKARNVEGFLVAKFDEMDFRQVLRMSLRHLYFSRLLCVKIYWDPKLNDFRAKSIDPRKVRMSAKAKSEEESDWVIEEVDCQLSALLSRFEDKKDKILEEMGMTETDAMVDDPSVTYREAWIGDSRAIVFRNAVLDVRKNPYWDWDGVLITTDEANALAGGGEVDMESIEADRELRTEQAKMNPDEFQAYLFNHFDRPRKPYIFATILNDSDRPIGRTSLIEQAIPLQEQLDRRKRQIDSNAELINGMLKVDSQVMGRDEAMKLTTVPGTLAWGEGVVEGVKREVGQPLPAFIFDDLQDCRNEIDNIMATSSAFRGEREGTETKAGRLALIEQSYLNFNEMVQVVDYVCREAFNWFVQMMKVNYTEKHYAKRLGIAGAAEQVEMTRNDIEDGLDIRVIPGKTLPEDRKFRYERAQNDKDVLSVTDYLTESGYDDPKGLAERAMAFKANPMASVGIAPPPPEIVQPGQEIIQ